MKKQAFLLIGFVFAAVSAYAQGTASASAGAVSSSIQVSEVSAPASSNIDVLKKSLENQKKEEPASTPKTSSAAPSAKTTSSTLEMPINMGGNSSSVVKTQVQPRKTSSKAKSFSVAKKRTAAVKKAAPKTASTAQKAQPTELEKLIEKDNALLPPGQQAASVEEAAQEEDLSPEELQEEAEIEVPIRHQRIR